MIRSPLIGAAIAAAVALPGAALAQDAAAPTQDQATDAGKASAAGQPADADTVLARVGDTEITLGNLIAMRASLPARFDDVSDARLYDGILDQLIQQAALARTTEGDLSKATELALENQRRALLAGEALKDLGDGAVSDEAIRDAYEAQYGDAGGGTEMNAAHILVDSEEKAAELREEIENGADFAKVAKENSTGPSSASGGKLGWFGADQMVAPFSEAAAKLKPGEISQPVKTQFGWHLIKLNDTREKDAPKLADVRDKIARSLRQKAVEEAIDDVVSKADVERMDTDIDPAVLGKQELLNE